MSGIFRSAAMTLLSKTLQTLLYKYLSDVDVEGVALPSLYNTDGHSGWGVRLSNVKLRDGAKLKDLPPGKMKRPAKKKVDQSGTRRVARDKEGTGETVEELVEENRDTVAVEDAQCPGPPADNDGEPPQLNSSAVAPFLIPNDQNPEHDEGACESTSRTRASSPEEEEIATQQTAAESDTETTATAQSSDPPPAASTSSSSAYSWFSYLYPSRSRKAAKNIPPQIGEEDDASPKFLDDNKRTALSAGAEERIVDQQPPLSGELPSVQEHEEVEDGSFCARPITTEKEINANPAQADSSEVVDGTIVAGEGEEAFSDTSDDNEPDVEEEIETPMILRLGKEGQIGTLDVRLLGKEIQVLVEDADLTVEAVRLAPVEAEDKDDDKKDTTKTSRDRGAKAKTKKAVAGPKSVGDRVLAENSIARLFSIIPNLLLRDIRVRFIVRDEIAADAEAEVDASEKDTVVECAIELLSVTADGHDFFAHFRSSEVEQDDNLLGDDDYDVEDDYDDDDEVSAEQEYAEREQQHAQPMATTPANAVENQVIENDYMTKRIRTGRGPEGGIVIRILPSGITEQQLLDTLDESGDNANRWSRQAWISSTEFCLLRCSGLDMQARIFMGSRVEVQATSAPKVSWYVDEFDDYAVDAMLFGGVDHIAPGPQPPPLPAIDEQTNLGSEEEPLWELPGATTYQLDANGIQSSGVGSSFHRVARGMLPVVCSGDHLPCEYCEKCWDALPGVDQEHALDDSAPLGGLVVHVGIRDPLEINVDRPTLEAIGLLIRLFSEKVEKDDGPRFKAEGNMSAPEDMETESLAGLDMSERSVRSQPSRMTTAPSRTNSGLSRASSIHSKSSLNDSMSKGMQGSSSFLGDFSERNNQSMSDLDLASTNQAPPVVPAPPPPPLDEGDISNAFPKYMQPEKIQYLGIHLADIVFRVHVMMRDTPDDNRLSFCYWSILAKCLTVDHHKLAVPGLSFQDARCDIGHLSATEYRGVEQKQLASMGIRQRVVDFDEITVETLMTRDEDCERPPWPSTSAVLLDIPSPVESLVYESRERHALQLRCVSVFKSGKEVDISRTSVHGKLGATALDVPSTVGSRVSTLIEQARTCVLQPKPGSESSLDQDSASVTGGVADAKATVEQRRRVDALMKYKIQLDGARLGLDPLVNVRLPLSTLVGERSEAGISIESLLEHVHLNYGKRAMPSMVSDGHLSLPLLADLPESVRNRIFVFLLDLNPLARALGVRGAASSNSSQAAAPAQSSFLLYPKINKQIVKLGKKKRRQSRLAGWGHDGGAPGGSSEDAGGSSRRQDIMSELLRMDDDALEDLWQNHLRHQRRLSKRRSSSNIKF